MMRDIFKKFFSYFFLNILFSAAAFVAVLSLMTGEFPPSLSRIRSQTQFLQELLKNGTNVNALKAAGNNRVEALKAADSEPPIDGEVPRPATIGQPRQAVSAAPDRASLDRMRQQLQMLQSRLDNIGENQNEALSAADDRAYDLEAARAATAGRSPEQPAPSNAGLERLRGELQQLQFRLQSLEVEQKAQNRTIQALQRELATRPAAKR